MKDTPQPNARQALKARQNPLCKVSIRALHAEATP